MVDGGNILTRPDLMDAFRLNRALCRGNGAIAGRIRCRGNGAITGERGHHRVSPDLDINYSN